MATTETGTGIRSASATVGGESAASAVARLRSTFDTGRTRPLAWRLAQLAGIERLVTEREHEIAVALESDLGRPALDAWLGDVTSTRAEAGFARKHLRRWMRPERVALPLTMRPGKASVRFEPLGTVLVIGPWNYPVYLSLGPLVAAFAAGNCAVLKPSEHAPASSALLARLLPLYVDPAAVAVIEGDAHVTQQLIEQGLDHIFFTGGPEIGKLVMAAAAPHLTPVTLELGGKSPAIVTAAADIEVTARRIVWTKFMNSGQTCVAPDYVLVDEQVAPTVVSALSKAIDAMHGRGTFQPIVNERQLSRLVSVLDSCGGTVVHGGASDAANASMQPTIVTGPDPASPLMTDEIFGPILPVVTFASLDEAIARVRSGSKPLAAYLFSSDTSEQRRLVDEISSGGAVVNHAAMQVLVPQLPFGGVGTSGMGAYHGRAGFETFSHRKSVLVKPTRLDLAALYPPYSARTEKLLRHIF